MPFYNKCESTKCVEEDESAERVICSASFANLDTEKCRKVVHMGCCVDFLLKTNIDKLSDADHDFLIVCSKRCYNKVNKFLMQTKSTSEDKKRRKLWDMDDDSETSYMAVLADWLTTKGNYEKYRGSIGDTASKNLEKGNIARQIIDLMEAKGLLKGSRSMKSIMSKFSILEGEWHVAHSYLQANAHMEDKEKLREEVTTCCKYYYDLCPILLDRASSTLLSSSQEESPSTSRAVSMSDHNGGATMSLTASPLLKIPAVKAATNEEQKTLLEVMTNEEQIKIMRTKAKLQEIRLQRDEMKLKKELLLTRLELKQRGVDQESIDRMFPLTTSKDDLTIMEESASVLNEAEASNSVSRLEEEEKSSDDLEEED